MEEDNNKNHPLQIHNMLLAVPFLCLSFWKQDCNAESTIRLYRRKAARPVHILPASIC